MEQVTITVLIGVASGLCGIYFGYKGLQGREKKENLDDGKESGIVLTEIGYIKSGVDDIKREQREQAKTNIELYGRITAVEASVKQAHKRLDRVDDTLNLQRRGE